MQGAAAAGGIGVLSVENVIRTPLESLFCECSNIGVSLRNKAGLTLSNVTVDVLLPICSVIVFGVLAITLNGPS